MKALKSRIPDMRHIRKNRAMTTWSIVFFLFFVEWIIFPESLGAANLQTIFIIAIPLFFATLAQTMVMIVGSIDLSIGALMSLTTCIASYLLVENLALGIATLIVLGAVVGLANGFLVINLKVNPFIATFGMMFALEGAALTIRNYPGGAVPESLLGIVKFQIYSISIYEILILILGAGFFWFFLNKTSSGIHFLATGASRSVAKNCGINVDLVTRKAHLICGLITALFAGLFLTIRFQAGSPLVGEPYLLFSFAASALGATRVSGGDADAGSLLGAVFILTLIENAMNLALIDTKSQWIIEGFLLLVILAAVGSSKKRRSG